MTKTLEDLAEEHVENQPSLVLDDEQTVAAAIAAARFYAGYGDIFSLSYSADYPSAPAPQPAMVLANVENSLPIRDLNLIDKDTVITVGEWAVIRPLFLLYIERDRANLLEASRGLGADVFGRAVSEISQDIFMMENDILPAKAFVHTVEVDI